MCVTEYRVTYNMSCRKKRGENLQVSYTYLIGPVRFTRNFREIQIYILHIPLKALQSS